MPNFEVYSEELGIVKFKYRFAFAAETSIFMQFPGSTSEILRYFEMTSQKFLGYINEML